MHIKIYFNDKPVFLCDALNGELNEILHHPDAVYIDEISPAAIKSLLHEIVKEEFHAGVLYHTDLDQLKKTFFKHFTLIEAAGGIVENGNKELLFIFRLGKWDLPKGKVEEGEAIADTAVREVAEETGATGLQLKTKTGETYHTYHAFGKHYLKTTHWYHISCTTSQNLKPQLEEDISELKWVPRSQMNEPLQNTYPSIKDILSVFLGKK